MGLFDLLKKEEVSTVDDLIKGLKKTREDIQAFTQKKDDLESALADAQIRVYAGVSDKKEIQAIKSELQDLFDGHSTALVVENKLIDKIKLTLRNDKDNRLKACEAELHILIKTESLAWGEKALKARAVLNAILGYISAPVEMGTFASPEDRDLYNSELAKAQKKFEIYGVDSLSTKRSDLEGEMKKLRESSFDDSYVEQLILGPEPEQTAEERAQEKAAARERLAQELEGKRLIPTGL